MFEIADMKSSNKECSWASTQAYKLGLEVNEQNDHLIRLRKSEGSGSSMNTTQSPINDPSNASSNWNKLKVLLNEDDQILTPKGIQMLKADTNLNEEQIGQWHADLFHDCPNGKISKDIFLAVYEKLYPGGGKGEDFCKYTFATFDRDNIGTIEFHEFMLAIGLRQSNDLDLRYGIAFDIHNYNCSETMDANELAKAISTLYDLIGETDRKGDRDPKHRAEEIIHICGATDNKKLTRNKFLVGFKKDPVIRHLRAPDD